MAALPAVDVGLIVVSVVVIGVVGVADSFQFSCILVFDKDNVFVSRHHLNSN